MIESVKVNQKHGLYYAYYKYSNGTIINCVKPNINLDYTLREAQLKADHEGIPMFDLVNFTTSIPLVESFAKMSTAL